MTEQNLIQIQSKSFVSRSAILEHFTCPYKHYLTYWANETGLHPARHSLDLLIGSVVHRGLQHLFEHCRVEHPDGNFEESCVDEAVNIAKELWEKELSKKGLALKSADEYSRLDWIIAEQECLWEGLIRAFAFYRLPAILEEYDILEVEFEEVFDNFSPFITFLGKADGLFMRKKDKALVILSIKTSSEYAEVTTRNILHDMQGVSETYLAQERLERLFNQWLDLCWRATDETGEYNLMMFVENNITQPIEEYFKYCAETEIKPKIYAIQYEYLIKGRRRQEPQQSGIYVQQSFLCHPMKLDAVRKILLGKGGSSLNPAQYKWKWGAGKQPKGWAKTDIWNDIGIKTWVEMLAKGEVQPELGHPFDHILHTPDLIVRSEMELREWYTSTKFKAEQIREYVDRINNLALNYSVAVNENDDSAMIHIEDMLQTMIWQFFPKNTLSCHDYYGGDCHFVQHCHEMESIEDMVVAENLTPRIPHHELEKRMMIEKGLISDE